MAWPVQRSRLRSVTAGTVTGSITHNPLCPPFDPFPHSFIVSGSGGQEERKTQKQEELSFFLLYFPVLSNLSVLQKNQNGKSPAHYTPD